MELSPQYLNTGSFNLKENMSPVASPAAKRRLTSHGESIPSIRTRNKAKLMKVLGTTPPQTQFLKPIQPPLRKRKFDDAMDQSDDEWTEEDLPSDRSERSSSSKQLSTLGNLFNMAKRLRKDDKELPSTGSSPTLKKNRKDALKMFQKRRKSGELARRLSGDKPSLFKSGLKRKKSAKKIHLRNIEVSVLKSPEQIDMLDEEEKEAYKEQLFTDVMYGSPQTTPLKKTSAMDVQRTPRENIDSPTTAQKKQAHRGALVQDASIHDLVSNGLASPIQTIKIEKPKFHLALDKVFAEEDTVDNKYLGTPRPLKVKKNMELADVLAEPLCRGYLSAFLKKEYCEENMHFYENVIVYNTWKNKRQRLPHAKAIFDRFIRLEAEEQINIDLYAVSNVDARIKQAENDPNEHLVGLFDQISSAIEHIMLDSFSRFAVTPAYLEMMNAFNNKDTPLTNRSAMNLKSSATKTLQKTFSVGNFKKPDQREIERRLAFNG